MEQRTILVIEDEAAIARAVADRLTSEGFAVETVGDGADGIERARALNPDLVVLDLMLPGLDGLEVCRRIRSEADVPVVMLTARDDETDLIVGLGVGADDYVTKPFSPRELVARIHAVLRRSETASSARRLRWSTLDIDLDRRQVADDGETVDLTATEFDLLVALVRHRGAVCPREQLLADVWGGRDGGGARTVDSHVRALRRKLANDHIRTVYGIGYAAQEADT